MTNSSKSVFIDRNTSHIKHGWQEKRMIMEYNACVSCALIGHNFPTVLQVYILTCLLNVLAVLDFFKSTGKASQARGQWWINVLAAMLVFLTAT